MIGKIWLQCDPAPKKGVGLSLFCNRTILNAGKWLPEEESFRKFLWGFLDAGEGVGRDYRGLCLDGIFIENSSFNRGAQDMAEVRGMLFEGARSYFVLDGELDSTHLQMTTAPGWRAATFPGMQKRRPKGEPRVEWKELAKKEAFSRYGERFPIVGEDDDIAESTLFNDWLSAKGYL